MLLVLAVVSVAMLRSGASMRPIIWFVGFFAIVAVPQATIHLLDGLVLRRLNAKPPTTSNPVITEPNSQLQPVPWATVFGPKADPDLITDAKRGLDAILHNAVEAKLSFNRDGESALAARFESPEAAAAALTKYGSFFAFAQARGSDATGWTARRHGGQGEWVHVVSAGPELYAWTATTRERVLEHRIRAFGPLSAADLAATPSGESIANNRLVSKRLASNPRLMTAIVLLNLTFACLWFFKGSAWAARVEGSQALRPIATDALRRELLALPPSAHPIKVTTRPDGRLEINWNYADSRWMDLMRLHQMKRTHKLVLEFEESSRTVRVREYWNAFDASAGAGQLKGEWKQQTGIQFFAIEHKRVFGAQLDSTGKPTGELSRAYTFDLQALKRPIIEKVTGAGWTWQPVTWNAPVPLRWLTE